MVLLIDHGLKILAKAFPAVVLHFPVVGLTLGRSEGSSVAYKRSSYGINIFSVPLPYDTHPLLVSYFSS